MEYRNEWKHVINQTDFMVLRQRLRAVMSPDPHAADGTYTIRSLYFDNADDRALREKQEGVSRREKFRIRYYNGDTSLIRLEKKSKLGGLGKKESVRLTGEEAGAIAKGEVDWMVHSGRELLCELYAKIQMQGLRPKIIVDYVREPFVFAPGNVRVTLDYNIRTGFCCPEFLSPDCLTLPAGDAPIILEVKWDSFLPDIIRDIVRLPGRRATAFSKYAQCRIYG